jgi:hypothetical protein
MQEDVEELVARKLRDPGLQQEWLRQEGLSYGGLIAGCVAVMQPFLTAGALDLSGLIAVVSFAIAIPLLAALLMVSQHEAYRHRPTGLRLLAVAKAIGQGLAVLGIAAALWHVLWIAGVALVVSALVAIGVHSIGFSRLEGISGPMTAGDR